MGLVIYLSDGVTQCDATHKITATDLDVEIDAYLATPTDTYSANATISMPDEWQISFASPWTTWYGSVDAPRACPELSDTLLPVKFRQHSFASSSSGTFATNYDSIPDCTALTAINNLSATSAGASAIDLSWSVMANATYLKIERATDSGFTANLTTLTSTLAGNATTYQATGLSSNTTYYFRVTGLGTGRYKNSSTSNSANATTGVSILWEDLFSGTDNSVWDNTKWPTSVSYYKQVGGYGVMSNPTGTTVAALSQEISLPASKRIRIDQSFIIGAHTQGQIGPFMRETAHSKQGQLIGYSSGGNLKLNDDAGTLVLISNYVTTQEYVIRWEMDFSDANASNLCNNIGVSTDGGNTFTWKLGTSGAGLTRSNFMARWAAFGSYLPDKFVIYAGTSGSADYTDYKVNYIKMTDFETKSF